MNHRQEGDNFLLVLIEYFVFREMIFPGRINQKVLYFPSDARAEIGKSSSEKTRFSNKTSRKFSDPRGD